MHPTVGQWLWRGWHDPLAKGIIFKGSRRIPEAAKLLSAASGVGRFAGFLTNDEFIHYLWILS
jgi:hypothetical protein